MFGRLYTTSSERCQPTVPVVVEFQRFAEANDLTAGDIWKAANQIARAEETLAKLRAMLPRIHAAFDFASSDEGGDEVTLLELRYGGLLRAIAALLEVPHA